MDWKNQYEQLLLNKEVSMKEVEKFVKIHRPQYLYKYGSFQSKYWKDIVLKGHAYLSPANTFNDPFDCKIYFDPVAAKNMKGSKYKEVLRKFYTDDAIEFSSTEEIHEKIVEGLREDIFVFCFSETWDSLLMWAHYANSYNGFCIEYEVGKISENVKEHMYPAIYRREYIDSTEAIAYTREHAGFIVTLTKAEEWQYEREWRIVKFEKANIYLRRSIKAIHIGMKCSKEIRQELIKWAKEKQKELYLIKPARDRYALERERIV